MTRRELRACSAATPALRLRRWVLGVALACALVVPALAAGSASAETVWLCKPDVANNPCLSDETATVELGNGSSFVEHAKPASNPPVDCFYVYPTVSSQTTQNADLKIDPEEEAVATAQASRFSQVCKVYAPMYPQLTLPALNKKEITPLGRFIAYSGVRAAFNEYLERFNEGRGFVLIGHSQGSAWLTQLVKELIDFNPALRSRLISAILIGGNLIVSEGQTAGGSFQNVPTCSSAAQTGCLVAYSSFLKEPPANALFGRPTGSPSGVEHPQVACVNPGLLVQGEHAGPLFSYYPTYNPTNIFPGDLAPFVQVPHAPTPWVATPDEYSGKCELANGASWLQLSPAGPPGDPREPVKETITPEWGTHLADMNVAMGNLVALAGAQSASYLSQH